MPETRSVKKLSRFQSLHATLAFSLLALSLTVLVLATLLQIFFNFRTQRNLISSQQGLIARSAANTVSGFIAEKFRALDQAADINSLADSEDRRPLVLNRLLGRDQSLQSLYLIDGEGRELFKASRSAQTASVIDSLKKSVLSETRVGQTYTSFVHIDPATSEPHIYIAVPTKNAFREPEGALIAQVNLKFMWDLVSSIKVGEAGAVYVVSGKGDLIAYADTSRVLARENLGHIRDVHEFITLADNGIGSEAKISNGIDGSPVIASHVDLGSPNWAVVVELPLMEAYAPVIRGVAFAIAVIILTGLLAILVGAYLSRRITDPIVELSAAAEKISHGDLSARATNISRDEIGLLAASFNSMAEKLQGSYGSLDANVREKTAALAVQVQEVERSKAAILNLLEDIEGEKKKAEALVDLRTQQLSAEKARLLASINSLSFGLVLSDPYDHIILKNPILKEILDYKEEPQTIHDIAVLLKNADSKIDIDIAGSCKRCMELKEPVEFKEVPYGKKYLRIICSPINTQAGSIGYIFLLEDITEAKVLERSRDEFFAVASHELRTPLTAIRGNADMILDMFADKIPDTEMKEMLMDINASSVRLIDIVNDFLEVSRLEQGKIEMNLEKFAPSDVIDKVMRDMKEIIAKRGIALRYETPQTPLPLAFADKNRTEQILVNLVGNSIKFTKAGAITISADLTGSHVRFRVTDTGTGISEHNQSLLFRKFQQAGEQMLARDVSQSTGLGLYICRLILSNMGGEIGLEKSELNVGSTFYFTIPVAKD